MTTDFAITLAPLSIEAVYAVADHPGNGAVVLMSGTVRNQTQGRPVRYLEYQAYEPMALKVFATIARQIRDRWPDANRVVMHHRIGKLVIGDISVLVAVGTPHRSEAFAACQFAIDTLKHNAPIWKKEHFADGSSEWVSIGACEEEAGSRNQFQPTAAVRPKAAANVSIER
jgi:molybdopterin synthase catalytic subunit